MAKFTSHKIGEAMTPEPDQNQSSIDVSQHDYAQLVNQFEVTPVKSAQGYDVLGDQFAQANTQVDISQSTTEIASDLSTVSSTAEQNNAEFDEFLKDVGSVDINEFKDELSRIVKNPNPIALYSEINKIKDKFSSFINYITKKIVDGFSTSPDGGANNLFIISIYKESDYRKVWYENLKEYIVESKHFDTNLYFKSSLLLDVQKSFLAKGLLKLYMGQSIQSVKDMINGDVKCKVSFEKIKNVYENLRLDMYVGQVDQDFLDENNPEIFLAQLALVRECDTNDLFRIFELNFDNIGFDNIYKIFLAIAKTYIKPDKVRYLNYVSDMRFRELKKELDNLVKQYNVLRINFRYALSDIIYRYNLLGIEEQIFYNYVQTRIIDIYYSKVTKLFYRNKEACRSRNDWADLKGAFVSDDKFIYKKEVDGIVEFKKIILEIDKNIFGTFLRPIIYKAISDELSVKKKDLYKIRYIMTLIMSESYKEYKSVYKFFEELECFLNYDDNLLNFSKLKLFSSNVILTTAVLFFLYIYAPVGVFLSSLLLILIGAYDVIKPFNGGVKWNLGLKSFATGFLLLSLCMWFLNLDNTKAQIAKTSAKIEKLGIYDTHQFMGILDKKVGQTKEIKVYTDILRGYFK